MKRLTLILACLFSHPIQGKDILVKSQAEYRDALESVSAGDTIVLSNGHWRDFEVLFTGQGSANSPITLTAETKGKVILSGQSNLRMAGEYLHVSGLVFKDGHSPTNTVIAFRQSKGVYANHSRVSEVVIDGFNNPERFEVDFWVMMYGKNNRFDHNQLVGKRNQGVTMAVRLDSAQSQENHHRIDHNYFGPRQMLGSNGGETLRIGTSKYSLTDSFTVVENNYFDRCNGEVEIVSSKSGNNIFRGNVFNESRGTLTLRHGNGNLVEKNVFFGNGVDHTGGIRVINKRQTIRNNYLFGLKGHRFGGALVIMNGVPDSPINRYHQVDQSIIENNSIIESAHIELAAGADEERSAPPVRTLFANNLIYNKDSENNIAVHDDISGIKFDGNILNEVVQPVITGGFVNRSLTLRKAANGLLYPENADAGASKTLEVLDRAATGVDWYPKPGPDSRFDTGAQIHVNADTAELSRAVTMAKHGDIILLAPGNYRVERTLIVNHPLTIRSADGTAKASLEFERSALFEIADGGSLKLVDLDISGRAAPDVAGNSVIRTSRYSMLHNYQLIIDGVTVSDLDVNHSFDFFTVSKHTFANRIKISRSSFSNITGHVLYMNKEPEDLGIYNGEYISIRDSRFSAIQGTVADIYRGGTDESTFGPHFELSGSSLESVGEGRRNKSQASISLLGVQAVGIHNNVFRQSRPVKVIETVGEPVTEIIDNEFVETLPPDVSQL